MPDRLLEPLATLGLAIVMNGWIGQSIALVVLMLFANWKQRRRNRDPYMRRFPSWDT